MSSASFASVNAAHCAGIASAHLTNNRASWHTAKPAFYAGFYAGYGATWGSTR